MSNPRATTTTARQRDVLVHALAADAKLDVEETANRGHAAALACRAMREGVDVVVALGGDGTVNEVVNGLLTDGIHPGVPALGIVPGGSTNVFARALGLPNDPVDATSILLDAMAEQRTRPIGLGLADDRYFLFTAGLGYDAAVVDAVEGHRRRGKKSTPALYVRSAVRTYIRTDRRHPQIRLELSDGHRIEDLYMVLVNNCDPWTYAGKIAISPTPMASFDTGLDVYGRTRMGAIGLLASAGRMLNKSGQEPKLALTQRVLRRQPANRNSLKVAGARIEHDLSRFALVSDEPLAFQLDGDSLDTRSRVEFRSVPQAIRVLI